MAEKTAATRKRSAASAKQEMLATLAETQKQLDEAREGQSRPQDRIEERAARRAVEVAEALSAEGVVQEISGLKSSIGKMLTELTDKLEAEVHKYGEIRKAIEVREKELAEIYEIEKSASTLAALIESQQRKREEFDAEMAREREQLESQIQTTRAQWDQERKQREAENKERDAAEAKRRQREAEEYRYASEREKQLARDQFADEKAKLERELADRRAAADKELAPREAAVAAAEQELADLRKKAEAFPRELEAAAARAAKESAARTQAEAAAREELLKREFAGERNVLTTRIAALEQTVKDQAQHIAKLSQQSEKAYGQVQEIAVRAIEGSGSAKALANLQQTLVEQGRRAQTEK